MLAYVAGATLIVSCTLGDDAPAQKLITDGPFWAIGVLRAEGFDATGGDEWDENGEREDGECGSGVSIR